MKLFKTFFLLFLISIIFITCERESYITSGVDIEKELSKISDSLVVKIKYSEEVKLSKNLTLRFDDLLEDSRCPINAMCIWPGRAKILLFIKDGDGGKFMELNTAAGINHDVYDKYDFRLQNLSPYPDTNVPFDKKAYVAEIVIRRW
jgi:hypothetical protein